MIAYLKGKIAKRIDKQIILDIGNIGYLVSLSAPILEKIKEHQEVELFIHSHIREDAFDLYGFEKYEDLSFFKKLISINGIGPKVGMEILSVPLAKIKAAVINEDLAFICQIPGIGKKIGQRIIIELKDKIAVEDLDTLDRNYQNIKPNVHEDAVSALLGLGYQRNEILTALKRLPVEITTSEDIITFFLKNN